jgi:hypothetical protein
MPLFFANWNILFPIACSLFIGLRLAEARSGVRASGWLWDGLHAVVYCMMAMAFAGVIIRVSPMSVVWIVALICVAILMLLKSRMMGRMVLFSSLTFTDSPTLSLQIAQNFSRLNRGWLRHRAKFYADGLARGMNSHGSMMAAGIAKTPFEILLSGLINVYGRNMPQQLPTAIQPLRIQEEFERMMGRMFVIPWLLLGLPLVLLIRWLVWPIFPEIYAEFQLPLGGPTGNLLLSAHPVLLTTVGSLVAFFWVGTMAIFLFGYLGQIFPTLLLRAPVRWLFAPYHRSLCLVALAVTSRAETQIGRACEVSSQVVPLAVWSHRFLQVGKNLDEGASLGDSLRMAQLLTPGESQMLSSAVHSNSLCWFLQELAVAETEKMLRRYGILVQLVVVIAVVSFAVLYGWVVLGLVEVLYNLVHHMGA